MKLKLLSFVPWMVTVAAWAEEAPVTVEYGFSEAVSTEVVRFGEECWIQLDQTRVWGWKGTAASGTADITADGRMLRLPTRTVKRSTYISLSEAARQLGARSWWEGQTFHIAGQLRSIEFSGSRLRVDSTLAFRMSSFELDNPRRIVLDLKGVAISPTQVFDLPGMVRINQFEPNVVRIVLDDPTANRPTSVPALSARYFDLHFGDYRWLPEGATEPDPIRTTPPPVIVNPAPAPNTVPVAPPRELRQVRVEPREPGRNVISFAFNTPKQQVPVVQYRSVTEILVDFSDVIQAQNMVFEAKGELVESVTYETTGRSTRAVIKTKRPLAFNVSTQGAVTYLSLKAPTREAAQLRGKRITLDAGHGAHDSGAHAGGVKEKDIALAVARFVAEELNNQGAGVVMTRNSDTFLSVGSRPQVANKNATDLLVSIHFNSNKVANSQSGLITFYHMQNPEGRLLATAIYQEIAKINDMNDIGVWSDNRIYQTGFGVLRGANMPSTLLELAFVNNANDRKLIVKPEWQEKVAKAIVRGIKVYFGDVKEEPKP